MSSSRESETALHVGRVVDPSVREDGEPEPEVQLVGLARIGEDSPPAQLNLPASRRRNASREPHVRVRARLWSQAVARPSSPSAELPGASNRDLELELVGTQPMHIGAAVARRVVPNIRLSPGWTAVFAALLGLCTVATFIAIAIQLDRRAPKVAEIRKR